MSTPQGRTSGDLHASLMRLGASRGIDPRQAVAAFLNDADEFRDIIRMPNKAAGRRAGSAAGRDAVSRNRRLLELRRDCP